MNILQLLKSSFFLFFGLRFIVDILPEVDNSKDLLKYYIYLITHSVTGLFIYMGLNEISAVQDPVLYLMAIPFVVIIAGEITGRIFNFTEIKKEPGAYYSLFAAGLIIHVSTAGANFMDYINMAGLILTGFLGLVFAVYSVYKNINIEKNSNIKPEQVILIIISLFMLLMEGLK
ncbi:MAG: hypothetical protein ACQEQC_06420 [Elusimicrobiota bacterium]